MLEVTDSCVPHLTSTLLYALKLGVVEQFVSQLQYLDSYACEEGNNERTRCILTKDSDPHSFFFSMIHAEVDRSDESMEPLGLCQKPLLRDTEGKPIYDCDRHWFFGGLIFHPGTGVPGISDGSHSVELNASSKPHWSVHT